MWLLNIATFELEAFDNEIPAYAILSHTWTEEELTFQALCQIREWSKFRTGYEKVKNFCEIAETYNVMYVWVDTCCINKESSAELTEAINSMYKWYRAAEMCIVYMVDVPNAHSTDQSAVDEQMQQFKASRWFTRGWTLQELIACGRRDFYSSGWSRIDSEKWTHSMDEILNSVTGIYLNVLRDPTELREICIAERMSWAARRNTTRPEDLAYCLMGIFGINMAILYGEGLRGAFRRLQDEIMKISFDQTLFAWRGRYESSGLLARTPRDFTGTPRLGLWLPKWIAPMISTNIGILFRPCIIRNDSTDSFSKMMKIVRNTSAVEEFKVVKVALQCDVMTEDGWRGLVLHLIPVESAGCFAYGQRRQAYRRIRCDSWETVSGGTLQGSKFEDVLVLEDENHHLVLTAVKQDKARWHERNGLEGTRKS